MVGIVGYIEFGVKVGILAGDGGVSFGGFVGCSPPRR